MGRIVCIVTTNTTMYDRFKTTTVQTLCSIECALSQKCRFSKKKTTEKKIKIIHHYCYYQLSLLLSATLLAIIYIDIYMRMCVCVYIVLYRMAHSFINRLPLFLIAYCHWFNDFSFYCHRNWLITLPHSHHISFWAGYYT